MSEQNNNKGPFSWLGFNATPEWFPDNMFGKAVFWLFTGIFALVFAAILLQFLLSTYFPPDSTDARNYALILAAALGAPFVIWRSFVAQKQVNIAEQGHMTDRLNKAIEQLGNRKQIEVRLGGIYALERIAADSQRDHISVMEILCAYVRHNAPATGAEPIKVDTEVEGWEDEMHDAIEAIPTPSIDIQAALSVIGRRKPNHIAVEIDAANNLHKRKYQLDLRNTNLQNLDLSKANLDNTLFQSAQMQGAELSWAQMQGADLWKAQMQGAYLIEAEFDASTILTACVFTTVAVRMVDFSAIKTLSDDQVKSMFGDSTTKLPESLNKPAWADLTFDGVEYYDEWTAAKHKAGL